MITCSPPLTPSVVPLVTLGGAAGPCPLAISSPRLVAVIPLVFRVAEEFLSTPHPRLSSPGTLSTSRVTPEVFPPWGNSSTPEVLVPLGDSNPPTTPWRSPTGFSATLDASGSSSLSPTPDELSVWFYPMPATPSLSLFSAPWWPHFPDLSASVLVTSDVALILTW